MSGRAGDDGGADGLAERVEQFRCLQLPGQPLGMHMGTMYLVNDLWREVERLRTKGKSRKSGAGHD